MASKPFIVKNGLSIGGHTVVDTNGKLHANNVIQNGTVRNAHLEDGSASPGTYGNSSVIPVVTVDNKGLVTSVTTEDVAGVSDLNYYGANSTLRITTADGSLFDATISTNDKMTVANAQALHTSVTANLNSYIANTNPRITNVLSNISSTNTALRTLVDDRMQVANVNVLVDDRMQVANVNLIVDDRMQVANVNTLVSDRMQVANVNLIVNDRMQVANTNLLVNDRMQVANVNVLVDDRMQVANVNSLIADYMLANNAQSLHNSVSANLGSYIANTNPRITNILTSVSSTNTDIRTLVDDRMQVANTNLLVNDRMQVANTNLLVNDRMQVANVNSLVDDRLQVANAVSTYTPLAGGTMTGVLAFDGTTNNTAHLRVDTDVTAHPSHTAGNLFWCPEQKAVSFHNDISGVSLQIGHEEWIRVKNITGSSIPNGTPVYATGQSGGIITIAPADATTEEKSQVIGVTTETIANNAEGVVTARGLVQDFDTSALTAGERVHVAANGALQTAAPTYPYFPVDVGTCVVSHATTGKLYVSIIEHTMEALRVTGTQHIDGNLTIDGDLTILGTETTTAINNLTVEDTFVYLGGSGSMGNTTFTGSGLDDGEFSGTFEGTDITTYYVRIDGTGTPDTFEWSKDNFSTTEATGVSITGNAQELDNGVKITFNATTGHTSNDKWQSTATPVNVDLGIVGNRNTGNTGIGYTHLGLFYDVSDNRFKVFDVYSPEPEGDINVSHSSYRAGNFQANTIYGNLTGDVTGDVTGTASSADSLSTARNIILTGDATGSASFDGTANASITVTVADDSHNHSNYITSNANDTATGRYVFSQTATIGSSVADMGNASILVGSTSAGIGIDSNEIMSSGEHLYIGTAAGNDNNVRIRQNGTDRLTINSTGIDVVGSIEVDNQVFHSGDIDTYMQFNAANSWRVVAGGSEAIRATSSAFVVNENGGDYDFRVESNGRTNMLFVNGGDDEVGINTNDPNATLGILQKDNGGNGDIALRMSSATNSQDVVMRFQGKDGSGTLGYADIVFDNDSGNERLQFKAPYNTSSPQLILSDSQGAIFNEGGSSIRDFRVESDTSAHMLFVDAGVNRVGIGKGAPQQTLDVSGGAQFAGRYMRRYQTNVATNTKVAVPWRDDGTTTLNANYTYEFELSVPSTGTDTGAKYLAYYVGSWKLHFAGRSGTSSNHPLGVIESNQFKMYHNHGSTYPISCQVTATLRNGDDNVLSVFGADGMMRNDYGITRIGSGLADWTERLSMSGSGTVFNEGGSDTNFRIESDGNANMFFLDAGNNRIGIGTGSPAKNLHVTAGSVGTALNDEITHAEISGGRHHLDFKEIRTAAGSDWPNTTYKLQMRVDAVNHQSIDFVSDGSSQEHIDIRTGNQVFNTRFMHNGRVGIGTTSPTHQLEIAGADPVISLKDTSATGTGAVGWVEFNDSAGSRLGYVGYGSTGNSNLYIRQIQNAPVEITTNDTVRFTVEAGGDVTVESGDLYVPDQIIHLGDTNTYMQFHAADQWRVVTGGTERLEVNNTQVTSAEPIHAPSFHGDGSNLTGIDSGGLTYTESASAPASPSAGDEWYDTGTGILYKRIESSWVQNSPAGGIGIYNSAGTKVN